jgi:Helix-turn-helix
MNESDLKARLDERLKRWEQDHLKGGTHAVIKYGRTSVGPPPLNEFGDNRLTFNYAKDELEKVLFADLNENFEKLADDLSQSGMPDQDSCAAYDSRCERQSKEYLDRFRGEIEALRSKIDDLWDEREQPFSNDEIEDFIKIFELAVNRLRTKSMSNFRRATTTARHPTGEDEVNTPEAARADNAPESATPANTSTRRRRRELLKHYRFEHDFTMADFARHAGMSVTAIQGMVRGDRSRYSEETLFRLLKTIGVAPDKW